MFRKVIRRKIFKRLNVSKKILLRKQRKIFLRQKVQFLRKRNKKLQSPAK